MQFDGILKAAIAAAVLGVAPALAACGGGSSPSPAASPAHTNAASALTNTAPSAGGKEAAACRSFHAHAVAFASNVKAAGTDPAAISAAYGGFVPPIEQDQSGTEGTPLNAQFDALVAALQKFASNELSGGNPSNASVISSENAVFGTCRGVDPGENWSPGG